MIEVWILIFYMSSGSGGGPILIDNIASKEECAILRSKILAPELQFKSHHPLTCLSVKKVK